MNQIKEAREAVSEIITLGPGTEIWNRHPLADQKVEYAKGIVPDLAAIDVQVRGRDELYAHGPVTKVSAADPELINPQGALRAGDVEPGKNQIIWWYNK